MPIAFSYSKSFIDFTPVAPPLAAGFAAAPPPIDMLQRSSKPPPALAPVGFVALEEKEPVAACIAGRLAADEEAVVVGDITPPIPMPPLMPILLNEGPVGLPIVLRLIGDIVDAAGAPEEKGPPCMESGVELER